MWFRNLRVFRFTEPVDIDPGKLPDLLAAAAFHPCGRLEPLSYGFATLHGDTLAHVTDSRVMLRTRKEEKIVPSGVVRRMVGERAAEIEAREGRPVRRKEREAIREALMLELLPRALTRQTDTYAYIDLRAGWLVVDASSAKRADELLALLRKVLERLPVRPLTVAEAPSAVMTRWISADDVPADVVLGDECELRDPMEEGGVVRARKHDLAAEEIRNHLAAGKRVTKLAVEWDGRVTCMLDDELNVRRLRFTELVQEALNDIELEDEAAAFDADFAIMGGELARFLPRLAELFGGEAEIDTLAGPKSAVVSAAAEEVDAPF